MNKLADEEKTIATPGIITRKQLIAAVIFSALALLLDAVVPTVEIAWVSALLVLTIYLFAFEVVGVDVSPKMIRLARRRLGRGVELHLADLERPLAFLDSDGFDIVLCSLVLDYVKDWRGLFGEFNRLLRGFGVLVFSTGHPFHDYNLHKETSYYDTALVEDTWTGFGIEVAVPYYRRSLSSMLTPLLDAGFTLEQVLEPRPGEDLKAADAKAYESLRELPGFICVRARKSTATRPVKSGRLLR